jgi:hypothetical protein
VLIGIVRDEILDAATQIAITADLAIVHEHMLFADKGMAIGTAGCRSG